MFKTTINYTINFCILDFHTTKFKAFSQYYSTVTHVISYDFCTLRILRILPVVFHLYVEQCYPLIIPKLHKPSKTAPYLKLTLFTMGKYMMCKPKQYLIGSLKYDIL